MFQRRTSRRRTRESRDRMLALKVQSPRILFFDFLKLGGRFMKFGLILMAVMALGFVGRLGWEELFVKNTEEFGIKEVPLTDFEGEAPRFLTHSRIVVTTGLDLDASIFALDTNELEETLRNLPETTEARVTRRLPGTLKIEVSERTPVAWLDCDQLGVVQRDRAAGLLIDEAGVPFKCASQTLWDFAERLPVIRVLQAEDHEIMEGQEIKHEGTAIRLGSGKLGIRFHGGFRASGLGHCERRDYPRNDDPRKNHCYSLLLRAGTSTPKACQAYWPCPGQGQGVEISKPHSG
jgi:hypothetical protein